MRLKRLTLHGFKTFADKTVIEFTPGVTAIVGPNGSGKSNLLDALTWCLGEQKANEMFREAGFTTVETHKVPEDIINVYYVVRK